MSASANIPANITDPIREHARATPEGQAVILHSGEAVSYAMLERAIDAVAAGLRGDGIRPGDTVCVRTPNGYQDLVARLAIARLGAVIAPISMAPAGLTAILGAGEAPASKVRAIPLAKLWAERVVAASDQAEFASHQDLDAVCAYFPTSGTTGRPRHTKVTHHMFGQRIRAVGDARRLSSAPREICSIGPATSFGFRCRVNALWEGGTVVMVGSAEQTMTALNAHRVNRLIMSPGTLQTLLQQLPADGAKPAALEEIETTGTLLPDAVYTQARDRLCARIIARYGSTEASWVASAPAADLVGRQGAIGRAEPGVEVEAVGQDGRPVPAGTAGVMRIRSANCVSGYHGDPEASARVFREGWFYPGDEVVIAADGMISIVGRTSDVINRAGNKISPQAVEEVLRTATGIADAAVFAMPSSSGETRVWAAIVPATPGVRPDVARLREFCKERLKLHAPDFYLLVKAIPRNDMGKIQRQPLQAMAAKQIENWRNRQAGSGSGTGRKVVH